MSSPQPAEQEHSRSVLQRIISAHRRVVAMLPDQAHGDRRLSDTGKVVLLTGLVSLLCVDWIWLLVKLFVLDPALEEAIEANTSVSVAMTGYEQLVYQWRRIMKYPLWIGLGLPLVGIVMIAAGRIGLLRFMRWLGVTGQRGR